MAHPSQMMPSPGSVETPKARGVAVERHTTKENIRKFFDPTTYIRTPDCVQKRAVSPASSHPSSSKVARMTKPELLLKFKLAAELNGVDWAELVVSCSQFSTCLLCLVGFETSFKMGLTKGYR